MLRKIGSKELDARDFQNLYEQCVAQMAEATDLTEKEKQEILRQLQLPDEDWEPIELAEGLEPISETIIKMRRGNNP